MGYYATTRETTGPIVITGDKVRPFAQEIADTMNTTACRINHGTLIALLEQDDPLHLAEGIVTQLAQYGFEPIERQGDDVVIEAWWEQKMPYDWDWMWPIIAKHTKSAIDWIFVGEDQEIWAECIDGDGNWTTRQVHLKIDRPALMPVGS